MQVLLKISTEDIFRLKAFMSKQKNAFVDSRWNKNVLRNDIRLDPDTIIKGITMCLLTSQQQSGPETPVSNFMNLSPFPFTIKSLTDADDPQMWIKEMLESAQITRFKNRIPAYLVHNFNILQRPDEWNFLYTRLSQLLLHPGKEIERTTACLVQDKFRGLGPKQARNFLQFLGLTQFEIPIDSRVADWLSRFGFPIPISPTALQDRKYYHFAMDHLQALCEEADILPCMLDAAIFSNADTKSWEPAHIPY